MYLRVEEQKMSASSPPDIGGIDGGVWAKVGGEEALATHGGGKRSQLAKCQ